MMTYLDENIWVSSKVWSHDCAVLQYVGINGDLTVTANPTDHH